MLLAVASFVLHGSAMARMQAAGPCAGSDQVSLSHSHGDHRHASAEAHDDAGIGHVQASADSGGHDHGRADHHADGAPCCGMSCAIAITPVGPDLLCAPVALSAVVPAFAEAGGGIDPNGLKRPPRTPDIA